MLFPAHPGQIYLYLDLQSGIRAWELDFVVSGIVSISDGNDNISLRETEGPWCKSYTTLLEESIIIFGK